jgi:hypothetical protein
MDWMWERLAKGYAEGESLGAFRLFDRSDVTNRQSEVAVLCGLLLGQRVSLETARQGRSLLFQWLWTNATIPARKDIVGVVGVDVGGIVWHYAREDAELSALSSRAFRQWATSNLSSVVADRILNIAKESTRIGDLRQLVVRGALGTGIGKWTQKAFAMICQGENHLLHEDLWIKKRWFEFCRSCRCPNGTTYTLKCLQSFEKPVQKHLTFRQLSFLLWRITPTGARLLAKNIPLPKSAFVFPSKVQK